MSYFTRNQAALLTSAEKPDEVKKTDICAVLKYNQNHDKLGMFSTSGHAASTQDTSHGGESMVSPNIGENGMTGGQANRKLRTKEHQRYVKAFSEVDSILGVSASQASAVGAWADGGENSTVQTYGKNVSYEQLSVSTAMKAMLAEQKAAVVFKAEKGGDARMHTLDFKSKQSVTALSKGLVKAGIEYHTIIKTEGGYQVKVFASDKSGAKAVAKAVANYTTDHGAKHTFAVGKGEFAGDPSWESRSVAVDHYEATINAYTAKHPEVAAKWNDMLRTYKSRISKATSILGDLSWQ